jgi:phage tail-like protein
MRKTITGLPTAHQIGTRLPAVYLGDDFIARFTEAFDQVLAPIFAVLDCLPHYLDPRLTPPDFLDWLSAWVALPLDDSWDEPRRRELIANAVELHRWRGTRRGLAAHVRLVTGGEVTVVDSGGCTWSTASGGPIPGRAEPGVEIQVRPTPGTVVSPDRLRAVIADALPAHVPATVRVIPTGRFPVPSPEQA